MLIKAGVDISRLNRDIRRALPILNAYALNHKEELIITSTYDGNHSAGSLHYGNDAIDMRYLKSIDLKKQVAAIKVLVGKDYDVIAEGNHIHIEYDPQ